MKHEVTVSVNDLIDLLEGKLETTDKYTEIIKNYKRKCKVCDSELLSFNPKKIYCGNQCCQEDFKERTIVTPEMLEKQRKNKREWARKNRTKK